MKFVSSCAARVARKQVVVALAMLGGTLGSVAAAAAQDPSLCQVKPPVMNCDPDAFVNAHVERNDDPVVELIPEHEVVEPKSEATYQTDVLLNREHPDGAAASSACNLSCASYTWAAGTPEAEVPDWVTALEVYRERVAGGYRTTGVTYFSDGGIVVAAASRGDCQDRRVCLFQHAGFAGRLFQGQGVGREYFLDGYNFSRIASAAVNTGHTSCMETWMQPHGRNFYLPPRHQTGNLGRYNDDATSVYIGRDGSARAC